MVFLTMALLVRSATSRRRAVWALPNLLATLSLRPFHIAPKGHWDPLVHLAIVAEGVAGKLLQSQSRQSQCSLQLARTNALSARKPSRPSMIGKDMRNLYISPSNAGSVVQLGQANSVLTMDTTDVSSVDFRIQTRLIPRFTIIRTAPNDLSKREPSIGRTIFASI